MNELIEFYGDEETMHEELYDALINSRNVKPDYSYAEKHGDKNYYLSIHDVSKSFENVDMEAQYAEEVTRIVFTHSLLLEKTFMLENRYESWNGGDTHLYEVVPEVVQVTKYKVVE